MKAAIGIFLFIACATTQGIYAKASKEPANRKNSSCCTFGSSPSLKSVIKWTAILGSIFLIHEKLFKYIDENFPKYRADAIKKILDCGEKIWFLEHICQKFTEAKDVIEYTSQTIEDNITDAQHA